jgi:hypothetical protein
VEPQAKRDIYLMILGGGIVLFITLVGLGVAWWRFA